MPEITELFEGGWKTSITGSGGGKGGDARKPEEDPESLRSRSEVTVVGILSEGEVQGFGTNTDPLTRIFLDGIPIKNTDGSLNFSVNGFYTGSSSSASGKGGLLPSITASIPGLNRNDASGAVNSLTIDYRVGTQNQDPMPGFDDIKTEQTVGVKLTKASGAISRTTYSDLLNKVRIRVGIGALFKVDKDSGDVKGDSVKFRIKIRPVGGSTFIDNVKTIQGKSRGPVDFEYEYQLQGVGPWLVSVERTTEDPTSTAVTNDLYWKAIVGIYSKSFRYPNSAILGIKAGAEDFTAVPQISADMLGIKIKVPTNYNPTTRVYTGIWNGTFQTIYSNNPAWVFYDLLTNSRYGAGQFIAESQVDRYSLYSIAQYCDALVPNGRGGLEPRLIFNAYITDRGEAYEILNSLAAAFRGMLYFSEGTIYAIQDKPKSITKIFSPANVIQEVGEDGTVTGPPFNYEGTARKARKTVALVSWNDANDQYKAKIEYIEDREGIDRYGYRELEIRAFGTTSQGQAQRIGRWALLTDQLETEILTFKVFTEGLFILPGEIIGIADPAKSGKRYGGRLINASTSVITIDNPFTIVSGLSYQASVMTPSGTVESRTVTNGPGTTSTLTLSPALSSTPIAGAPWVLQENNSSVRTFRVISLVEDNGIVTIMASLYDESKFALADQGTIFGSSRTSIAGPQIVPVVRSGSIILEVP